MEAAQYTGPRLESCICRLIKGDLCVTEHAGKRLARWSKPTIEDTLSELRRPPDRAYDSEFHVCVTSLTPGK